MPTSDLSHLFEEAATLASSLPATLQPIAFGKALDVILAAHGIGVPPNDRTRTHQKAKEQRDGQTAARSSNRSSGRVGPKSALSQLLHAGYFAAKREIADVQTHLKDSHGHEYKSKELAVSFLRLVREGLLKRHKNVEGQYEYWAE